MFAPSPWSADDAGASPVLTIEDVTAAPYRADDRKRDAVERPGAFLEEIGYRPRQHVVEIWPGDGYWVRLIAPLAADAGGHVIAAHLDPRTDDPGVRRARGVFEARIGALPAAARAAVAVTDFGVEGSPLAPTESLDAVWVFDAVAPLVDGDLIGMVAERARAALKAGGVAVVRGRDDQTAAVAEARGAFLNLGFSVIDITTAERPGFLATKD